jgi:hypothetical protein
MAAQWLPSFSYTEEYLPIPKRLGPSRAPALCLALLVGYFAHIATATTRSSAFRQSLNILRGMPPVVDPANFYSEAAIGRPSPAIAGALVRVYVPNRLSGDVYVIDPTTLRPQHVVPAWDLRTLWVTNNGKRGRMDGSLTPIDPWTGKPGRAAAVVDPYNMYFLPNGRSAIVVVENRERLDFRDPHSMALRWTLWTPQCPGINHGDFSIDGR